MEATFFGLMLTLTARSDSCQTGIVVFMEVNLSQPFFFYDVWVLCHGSKGLPHFKSILKMSSFSPFGLSSSSFFNILSFARSGICFDMKCKERIQTFYFFWCWRSDIGFVP